MLPIPSFGLLEIFILAGCAGLVLAIGAIVVAVILNKRTRGRALLNGSSAEDSQAGEWARGSSRSLEDRRRRKRVVVIALMIVVALVAPLLVVAFGILSVIPVRQVREPAGTQGAVVISAPEITTGTPGLGPTLSGDSGLMPTPGVAVTPSPQPVRTSTGSTHRDFLDPDNTLAWAIVLPSLAGLVLLIGAAAVALIGTVWKKANLRSVGVTQGSRRSWARARMALLLLLFWFALSAFLVLDLLFAISLSYRSIAIYAAFWALVGALLLYDRPLRGKLVVLALLVIVLLAVRSVDWTSRKPFLKNLARIQAGMTPAQVDRIMDGYLKENAVGPPGTENQYEYNERGEIVKGNVTFRHTDKGWGDADWGVVTFEKGRVVEIEFLPD